MSATSEHRTALWVIVSAATLTVMAGAILGPIVPRIQAELGVSGLAAGLIITTHGGVIVLASPLVGALIDRIGPRRPFIAGLVVYGLGGGAGLVVDSYGPLLASRVVLGLGTAAVYTSVTVLLYRLYEGEAMERALGYRSSANSAGAAVWPLIGGAAGAVAWNLPFGVYLVALPLGLLAFVTVPEPALTTGDTPATDSGSTDDETDSVGDDGSNPDADDADANADDADANADDTDVNTDGDSVLAVLRQQPALLAVYLLYFGANALLYVLVVFYPQFLAEVGVTDSFEIGLYLAANGTGGGLSAALYGRLVARTTRSTLVAAALGLWVVGLGLVAIVDTPIGAAIPVVCFGLGLGLIFPSAFAWVEQFAPADRQGQFSSYLASAGYTGQFVSPVIFGALLGLVAIEGLFGVAALVAAVALGGLILAGRR